MESINILIPSFEERKLRVGEYVSMVSFFATNSQLVFLNIGYITTDFMLKWQFILLSLSILGIFAIIL